jgi:phosphate starvation-inducible protein PhoH and related proteins
MARERLETAQVDFAKRVKRHRFADGTGYCRGSLKIGRKANVSGPMGGRLRVITRKLVSWRYNSRKQISRTMRGFPCPPRTTRMTEVSLAFSSPDQIPLIFGTQDRFLRQVRETVGIDVTLRGDEVRLHGTDEQIKRGLAVFAELKSILERRGELLDSEVQGVLGTIGNGRHTNGAPAEPIDLLEKARRVSPRTPGQAEYVRAIRENDLVFCVGPAGCGKTYLAVAMAVNALRQEQVKKIVLVRPAVEAGERLGFLPGDLLAKVNPFLRPLLDAMNEMLDFEQVKRYMERDVVEIVPLAFMRGRTLNNTFIILDEGQNTTVTQMKMFLTRMGTGSKIVVTGDTTQTDLPPSVTSGLTDAIDRLADVDGIANVRLTGRDIVRHRLVREIVEAYEDGPARRNSRRKA